MRIYTPNSVPADQPEKWGRRTLRDRRSGLRPGWLSPMAGSYGGPNPGQRGYIWGSPAVGRRLRTPSRCMEFSDALRFTSHDVAETCRVLTHPGENTTLQNPAGRKSVPQSAISLFTLEDTDPQCLTWILRFI
jgi:hypothetical protein